MAGCQPFISRGGTDSASSLTPTPTTEPGPPQINPTAQVSTTDSLLFPTVQSLDQILSEPEMYLGKQITVEGILEAEGQMPSVRFFLRVSESERLEVSSWAPLEIMHPPSGKAKTKSMADYIGLRLRLTGIFQAGESGYILEVDTVDELKP